MASISSEYDANMAGENSLQLPRSSSLVFNASSSSSGANSTLAGLNDDSNPYQHLTEVIVYQYICLTIFVIGLIGNSLSILVFSRSSLRHRSCAVYFLALAITDIVSLSSSFVDTVLPSYNSLTLTIKSEFICKLNPLMIYFTADLSNFLLAAASIDRAVSIQWPVKARRYCRACIAICIIVGMSIFLLLINGHIFWGFEIVNKTSYLACRPSSNLIVYRSNGTTMTYERFYKIFDSLDMLFAVMVPFIVMLICNIIILVRVITSRRSIRSIVITTTTIQSKKFRKRHDKEKQLTVMLLGSAAGSFSLESITEEDDDSFSSSLSLLAFLVFTLPTEINDTVRAFRPEDPSESVGAIGLMTAIVIAMGQFNHAIHFYIYTLTGGVFRAELIKLFTISKLNVWKRETKSLPHRQINTDQTHLRAELIDQKNGINVHDLWTIVFRHRCSFDIEKRCFLSTNKSRGETTESDVRHLFSLIISEEWK